LQASGAAGRIGETAIPELTEALKSMLGVLEGVTEDAPETAAG
jgi:hypothetical protein